ncbi:MAG TPA: M48 family metallopeptidase [Candidatus Angelobacter sp.]|jgi:Zn-dependent protease with chaperone function|nr:M48 family metallopeptidase [Candidatus Angelobacter sp.]
MKLLGSLILLVLCLGVAPHSVNAQTPAAAAPAATTAAPSSTATQTTEYTLPPDKLAKAKALYELRGKLRIIDTAYSLIILLAILSLGIAAKYRDWAEKVSGNRFVQALIFVPLFILTLTVLGLPLDAYQQSISLQYGLSVQGWGSWLRDVAIGQALSLAIFTFAIWGITSLIRKSPRRWWLYTALMAVPFVVFLIFLAPVVFDPLFNNFTPLEITNPQLVDAIERVSARAGEDIPRNRIFLMDASKKVTTLNAYVTGFGPSKRIVIWDTTIKNASTPETLFVVGHEMGHYVLNHVRIGIAATAVGLLVGFYLLYVFATGALVRFQQRWHMRELSDWAAVPMLLLIFSILNIVAQPIGSAFSRTLEHNADIYGLEVTHGINANSQETAAHAFQILGELSLSYPYPSKFVVFWYADHPPINERVPFAHNYDPWSKGEQPKYVK